MQLCCARNEGGPLGAGIQVQASNNRERRWSKAIVVSVAVKGVAKTTSCELRRDERD